MQSFAQLRSKLQLEKSLGGPESGKSYYSRLYSYMLSPQIENIKVEYLIDLILAAVEKQSLTRAAEEYFTFFGRNCIYDSYLIEAANINGKLKKHIIHNVPVKTTDHVTLRKMRSWGKLLLAIDWNEELLNKVFLFCLIPSGDMMLNIHQAFLMERMANEHYAEFSSEFVGTLLQEFMNRSTDAEYAFEVFQLYKSLFLHRDGTAPENRQLRVNCEQWFAQVKTDTWNKSLFSFSCQSLYTDIPFLQEEGILLLQFLFHGDPERSGAGDSGGLATLVGDLGNVLGREAELAGVITVVLYDTADADVPFVPITFPGHHHAVVRLPLFVNGSSPERFVEAEAMIEYRLLRLIEGLRLQSRESPAVFHVRYLDAATLVAARLAAKLGIPLVSTLTPDPHRTVEALKEEYGESPPEHWHNFHRIIIGDRLCDLSRGIVGIGRSSIAASLMPYFPQLKSKEHTVIEGIDEGIRIGVEHGVTDLDRLFSDSNYRFHIDTHLLHQPVILNIGRLHPAKGQYVLLQAWDQSGLWKVFNLIVVGGNFEHPTEMEAEIIELFHHYMSSRSYLQGRVLFRASLPNPEVRNLQDTLAKRSCGDYPDLYLCSSSKEEFGISIVEAMSAGMIALAPLKGGAQEYIHHGVNGFLIDTGDPKSMGRDVCTYIFESGLKAPQWKALRRNAIETIQRLYSLERIAENFTEFYTRVVGTE